MIPSRLRAPITVLALVAVGACAERAPGDDLRGGTGPQRLEANTTVLESGEHGPELCLGGVADSYPPQCGGVPIANWDWDLVEGEESASGTTWGSFHVVGTYDGTIFTVSDAGPFERPPPEDGGDPVDTPCPEPEGGWVAVDASKATEKDMLATMHAAEDQPDFAGFWIDYVEEPADEAPVEPGGIIANVAFTGNLERHTAEIRERWGGPLCVVEHEWTFDALRRAQAERGRDVGSELGLQVLYSGISMYRNVVEVGVVVVDDEERASVEERYGDAVRLVPSLTPVAQ